MIALCNDIDQRSPQIGASFGTLAVAGADEARRQRPHTGGAQLPHYESGRFLQTGQPEDEPYY